MFVFCIKRNFVKLKLMKITKISFNTIAIHALTTFLRFFSPLGSQYHLAWKRGEKGQKGQLVSWEREREFSVKLSKQVVKKKTNKCGSRKVDCAPRTKVIFETRAGDRYSDQTDTLISMLANLGAGYRCDGRGREQHVLSWFRANKWKNQIKTESPFIFSLCCKYNHPDRGNLQQTQEALPLAIYWVFF